jgi:integrase
MRKRKRRLETKEMPRFVAALDKLNGKSEVPRELFWFLLLTGRSRGISSKARWVDLDLETGEWQASTRAKGAGADSESEVVPLPAVLVDRLVAWRNHLTEKHEGKLPVWVFPGRDPAKPLAEPKNAWAAVCKAAKIKNLTMPDLRRTMSSWAQEVNVSVAAISKQLGHADISTTLKHYTEIGLTPQRMALESTVAAMLGDKADEASK